MSETRVEFKTIVKHQLPDYVRDAFPLLGEFLSQYYLSQEFQGAPVDLIQNIDRYIKLNTNATTINSTRLRTDVTDSASTISVDSTAGFPDQYGLLRIGNEIITYTGKSTYQFTGCVRGWSGYVHQTTNDQFVFSDTLAETHSKLDTVENLSVSFLTKFLTKAKYQLLPGLEDTKLFSTLNKNLFLKQAKDFYTSKGTDESFKILFKALYGEDVEIVRPSENLLTPSNSLYNITRDMIVEPVAGNIEDIEGYTLYQNSYADTIFKSYAPIVRVERILVGGASTDYYKVSFDANYNRDLQYDGAEYGSFVSYPKTRLIGDYTEDATTFDVDSTVGFPKSGEINVTYADRTIGIVSYTSKSLTQFYGLSGLTDGVSDNTPVGVNTSASVTLNTGEVVQMKITNVLSNFHAGELVGWVDGNPYYGPYHVHMDRKMVGAKHVRTAHAYIYDTKEESLQNPSVASATVSTTPTQQLASTTSSNTSSTTTSTGAASGGTSGGTSGGSSGGGGGGGYGY